MRLFRKRPVTLTQLIAAKEKVIATWSIYKEIWETPKDNTVEASVQREIEITAAVVSHQQAEREYRELWYRYRDENNLWPTA